MGTGKEVEGWGTEIYEKVGEEAVKRKCADILIEVEPRLQGVESPVKKKANMITLVLRQILLR